MSTYKIKFGNNFQRGRNNGPLRIIDRETIPSTTTIFPDISSTTDVINTLLFDSSKKDNNKLDIEIQKAIENGIGLDYFVKVENSIHIDDAPAAAKARNTRLIKSIDSKGIPHHLEIPWVDKYPDKPDPDIKRLDYNYHGQELDGRVCDDDGFYRRFKTDKFIKDFQPPFVAGGQKPPAFDTIKDFAMGATEQTPDISFVADTYETIKLPIYYHISMKIVLKISCGDKSAIIKLPAFSKKVVTNNGISETIPCYSCLFTTTPLSADNVNSVKLNYNISLMKNNNEIEFVDLRRITTRRLQIPRVLVGYWQPINNLNNNPLRNIENNAKIFTNWKINGPQIEDVKPIEFDINSGLLIITDSSRPAYDKTMHQELSLLINKFLAQRISRLSTTFKQEINDTTKIYGCTGQNRIAWNILTESEANNTCLNIEIINFETFESENTPQKINNSLVGVEANFKSPYPDGLFLYGEHFYPRLGQSGLPIIITEKQIREIFE